MTARDRLALGVIVLVAALAGLWFLALAPKRSELAGLGEQVAQAEQRRDGALTALTSAESVRRSLVRDRATLVRVGKSVPADDDSASLVYQVTRAARRAGIDARSLKVEASGGGDAAAAPTATPEPSGTSSGAGAATTPAAPLPPGAAAGAGGLSTMAYTFAFDGEYGHLRRLLRRLRDLTVSGHDGLVVRGRLLTIDAVAVTASRLGLPKVKAEVTITAYLAPPLGKPGAVTPGGATPHAAAPAASTAPTTPAVPADDTTATR